MPLPSTGPISLSQVNTELGRSATATINMNESAVRTLAGVGGSGTTISMQNLRGKSAVTLVFNNASNWNIVQEAIGTNVSADINPKSDGQIFLGGNLSVVGPTAYLSPTGAGFGADYETRITLSSLTTTYGSPGQVFFAGVSISVGTTTAFYNLSTERLLSLSVPKFTLASATGTLEIRKVGGSPSISRTFYLQAEALDS